ncbi:hypothetical protein AGDE_01043 [Angomonas deanei]|nr:hypothetical protein AGDE_01043 [Angomonas deanei]|eukprot:EPY42880.1 hypothetical protein AGDE_01043 [Angomonas deanei]
MAVYCFNIVKSRILKQPVPLCPESIPDVDSPIFITFKKVPSGDLRGCIGNFSPAPLRAQLRDYAIAAAFEDPRFGPIKESELPKLACCVSLLHSFEKCEKWDDWEIGKHGVKLTYKTFRSTYLPSIPIEQGWTKEQTIKSLLAKGGFKDKVTDSVLKEVSATRYQVSKCCVNYTDIKWPSSPSK